MVGPALSNPIWHLLENYVYKYPKPAPRVRSKPMEVICVGPPRSATESLQQALLQLGYDYTYHGWDILFEEPHNMQGWVRLARKKWYGDASGDCHISADEFDELLGHSVAVTDAASSVFAVEMVEAYPDAKVVLNVRRDLDAWHRSADKNLVGTENNWAFYILSWFCADFFWAWHVYVRFLWPRLFRSPDGSMRAGILQNGKWVYREHCNMIRGLVKAERLLEWSAEDGWEPLCKFLGKPVPDTPFPRVNDAAGFGGRVKQIQQTWALKAARNMAVISAGLMGVVALWWKLYTRA